MYVVITTKVKYGGGTHSARRYVLGNAQSEDMFINGMWFLVSILYTHSVVGGVLNHTGVIYGARTSLFLSSQRMPSRYGCVCNCIHLNNLSARRIFTNDIFGDIFYKHTVGCMLL